MVIGAGPNGISSNPVERKERAYTNKYMATNDDVNEIIVEIHG
jgi:hypothetical protein